MTQNKFLAEFAKLISITNLPKKRSFSLLLERFHPYPLFATVFSWYFYILCKPHVHCVALCSPHNLKGLLFGAGLLFLHKTYLMCQAMYLIFDLLHAWHIFLHLFNEKKHDKGKYNMPFCAYDCKKFFCTTLPQPPYYDCFTASFVWASGCKVIRLQFDVKSTFSVRWVCTIPLLYVSQKVLKVNYT